MADDIRVGYNPEKTSEFTSTVRTVAESLKAEAAKLKTDVTDALAPALSGFTADGKPAPVYQQFTASLNTALGKLSAGIETVANGLLQDAERIDGYTAAVDDIEAKKSKEMSEATPPSSTLPGTTAPSVTV